MDVWSGPERNETGRPIGVGQDSRAVFFLMDPRSVAKGRGEARDPEVRVKQSGEPWFGESHLVPPCGSNGELAESSHHNPCQEPRHLFHHGSKGQVGTKAREQLTSLPWCFDLVQTEGTEQVAQVDGKAAAGEGRAVVKGTEAGLFVA